VGKSYSMDVRIRNAKTVNLKELDLCVKSRMMLIIFMLQAD
jgi:hypothetical protein